MDCLMKTRHVGDYKKCSFEQLEEGDYFILEKDPKGKIFIKIKSLIHSYEEEGRTYKTIRNSLSLEDNKVRYTQSSLVCYKLGGRIEILLPIVG